jgi:hypothetical protein
LLLIALSFSAVWMHRPTIEGKSERYILSDSFP